MAREDWVPVHLMPGKEYELRALGVILLGGGSKLVVVDGKHRVKKVWFDTLSDKRKEELFGIKKEGVIQL